MSNRVVDLMAKAIAGFHKSESPEAALWRHEALAVIAALEKEGYKVLAREPTEEMILKAAQIAFEAPEEFASDEIVRAAMRAAHDAAPRYGEPSG